MPILNVSKLAEALLSNPCLAEAFSRAIRAGLETKGRIDRNVDTLLSLLNLPSRRDLRRIMTKLDVLQGSLTNINLKLDRLLDHPAPRRRRTPKPRPPTPPSPSLD